MALLDDAVFVRRADIDPRRPQSVVLQHRAEPRGQRPAPAALELVGRRREVVHPHHLRHAAQRPQRALQPLHQRLVGLPERQPHPAPAAAAQHELEQQVLQRLTGDRHPELRGVAEVELRLPPGRMDLGEVHLLRGTRERPPLPQPTLQRPQLLRPVAPGIPLLEPREQRRRLQHPVPVGAQQRLDLARPHLGERIGSRAPGARPLRRRGQRTPLPLARRPDAHPGRRGGGLLRLAFHAFPPEQPNLLVSHHPRGPSSPQGWPVGPRPRNRQF